MEDINLNSNIKAASDYIVSSPYEAVKLRTPIEIDEAVHTKRQPQTIHEYFFEKCEKFKEKPALAYQYDDQNNFKKWTFISYKEYADNVKHLSLCLLQLGVQQHNAVAILASNCPEWIYMELAAINIGAIAAGIYPTSSSEAVHYMLSITEAVICVVDTQEQWLKVKEVKSRLPNLKHVVQLKEPFDLTDLETQTDNFYYKWCDLKSIHISENIQSELLARQSSIYVNECALYVFTSGSEGLPKAVMISHDNILYTLTCFTEMFDIGKNKCNLRHISYLPLCHAAAQELDLFLSMDVGCCLYIANSQAVNGTILQYLPIVKPTFFFGVPRIFEKLQLKILQYINSLSGFYFYLMDRARKCVMDYHLSQMEGKSYPALKYWCARKYIGKLKGSLGLDNCNAILVGGAPLSPDVKRFFLSLDLPLINCYGLSESSGVIIADMKRNNFNAMGQPLKDFELKIRQMDEQQTGEIMLRGPFTFMGYLNNLENSKQTIDAEGWLHTGDCGFLDEKGNVILNGRIKEIIITSGGENVSAARIEMLIKQELPCLSNVVLIGDNRKYLTTLFTFKIEMDVETGLSTDNLQDETKNWLNSIGLYYEKISELWQLAESSASSESGESVESCEHKNYKAIIKELEMGLARVNDKALSRAQRVQYFTVLPFDFSTANGELGSILKLKRHVIAEKYNSIIDDMYREGFQNKFANILQTQGNAEQD